MKLNEAIEILLNKEVYVDKVIKVPFTREELKDLLMLCTQEVQFTFQGKIYIQADGVSMGSPLAPLLANVFMCELENRTVPKLLNYMTPWHRYVDDTFTFIDPMKIEMICEELNSFHPNIQFTYEKESENQLPFLDTLIERLPSGRLTTTVYRKPTSTNIYINWNSYAPKNWKTETLRNMARRAALICSNEELLNEEFRYLSKVFTEINDYPPRLVENIILSVKDEHEREKTKQTADTENVANDTNEAEQRTSSSITENKDSEVIALCVPYAGRKGEALMKKLKRDLKQSLPDNVKAQITYKATKLQTKFQVKDEIQFENQHNITYLATCRKCGQRYIGETKCRCKNRVMQHNKRDKNSLLLKHAKSTKHRRVWLPDFKIIGKGYKTDFKRKISESLHIKRHKPEINIQKDAYKLKLFY